MFSIHDNKTKSSKFQTSLKRLFITNSTNNLALFDTIPKPVKPVEKVKKTIDRFLCTVFLTNSLSVLITASSHFWSRRSGKVSMRKDKKIPHLHL